MRAVRRSSEGRSPAGFEVLKTPLTGLMVATSFLVAGCGHGGDPQPIPLPDSGPSITSTECTLVCSTIIGDVDSLLTYTIMVNHEPIASGASATYQINAPISTSKPPVSTTFISSDITFAIPAGLQITSVAMSPSSNDNFTSAQAVVDGGSIIESLTGSFPLDGTPRPTPNLMVVAQVTADGGATILWTTPTQVVGTAEVSLFGAQSTQTTTCHISDPQTLFTSHVVAP